MTIYPNSTVLGGETVIGARKRSGEMFFWCKASRRIRSFLTRKHNCISCKSARITRADQRKFQRMIYLDYNATTPLCEPHDNDAAMSRRKIWQSLERACSRTRSARRNRRRARSTRGLFGAKAHELIFTSGGTEANNLAVLGLARSRATRGRAFDQCENRTPRCSKAIEHREKREGFEVTWLNVSQAGYRSRSIQPIRSETIPACFSHGCEQRNRRDPAAGRDLRNLSRHGVLLHSDMVQSFGKVPMSI